MSRRSVSSAELSPRRKSQWAGFLGDVRNESTTFKEILQRASAEKTESNAQFKACAQHSFNAIHNVVRKKPDQVGRPLRQATRASSTLTRSNAPESPFEFEHKVANHDRWPVRPVTKVSQRILTPTRLGDHPGVARPKDIVCILGWPVSRHAELL
jgi:hypothetical protein